MLEKLAKQSAIYGISTIVGRLLSYLLTPYYTRVFGQSDFGIITDIYAIIPFVLILLTMGMESSYFRFATKAVEQGGGVDTIIKAKNRLFATTWGATILASVVFVGLILFFGDQASALMGAEYVANPMYVTVMALIVFFDVLATVPFARLREQEKSMLYVGIKLANIVLQVGLALGFGLAGYYSTEFGVGWAFVANLIASVITFVLILFTTNGVIPRIHRKLLGSILIYSFPLLLSGIAATAADFIDRQMIKYLVPHGAMAQLGVYGAVVKIGVVMTLFTQMYRQAAEPFFLSDIKKNDFVAMNVATMKYFMMFSMLIFLGIALFKDVFALIVGPDFREGIFILPIVLGANVLMGVWFNLSFWYKREEKTSFALVITLVGLAATVILNIIFVPTWGYYGAAWARFVGQIIMVAVSYYLNSKFFPTPYDLPRIGEYVGIALLLYALSVVIEGVIASQFINWAIGAVLLAIYCLYLVRREHINVVSMVKSILRVK